MNSLLQDLRYAFRVMRRSPGFTAVVVLTLALGIGVNTAMFSLADATLVQSPPVKAPDRLVAVYTTCRRGQPRCSSSYPDYLDYRADATTLSDLAAYTWTAASLGDEAGAQLVTVQPSTGNYFGMLGVAPGIGRLIVPADDERGAPHQVAVLSQTLWRTRFGADPHVIGSTVRLNGAEFQVVGVVPRGFRGTDLGGGPDLYIPFLSGVALGTSFWNDPSRLNNRGSRWIGRLVGRMAPGVTVPQVRAQLLSISEALAIQDPAARGPRSVTVDAMTGYILPVGSRADIQHFVLLLVAVAGMTLLIACSNLANLFLSRAAQRRREIGVRLALGAGRMRLARQLITESVVLAVAGGVVGLVLAMWGLAVLGKFDLPGGVPIASLGVGLDTRMLAIAGGLSVVTGILFGLVPAIQSTRPDLVSTLKGVVRHGPRRAWTRGSLVGIQVAAAFLLLVGAGLFLRTLANTLTFDPGFQPHGVALASFDLSVDRYAAAAGRVFLEDVLQRVERAPNVMSASLASAIPFSGGGFGGYAATFVTVAGYTPAPDEEMRVEFVYVSPNYFRTLGIPVLAGRGVSPEDQSSSRPAIVVNEAAATRWWPSAHAVGGEVTFGTSSREVVGVVGNAEWRQLGETATPMVFLPLAQFPEQAVAVPLALAVRTRGDPHDVLPTIRSVLTALDPDVPIASLQTMHDELATVLMPQRMGALLLTLFALLAVSLAALGIYGVVSFNVAHERRDIGIRMALGSPRRGVVWLFIRRMLVPVAGGLAAGVFAAFALSRGVAEFLLDVGPRDITTYATLAVLLVGVAALAAFVPAHRAARVPPVEALRSE